MWLHEPYTFKPGFNYDSLIWEMNQKYPNAYKKINTQFSDKQRVHLPTEVEMDKELKKNNKDDN